LEVASLGDPAGSTVFFHHGTPGSARTLEHFEPLLGLGAFYFVTMSRAGYGKSSRRDGRAVGTIVDDARAALEHYGRDAYTALGWSGGGPHALACGALDPSCRHVVTLASVAPLDGDFDWTAGMGPENVEEFALALEGGAKFEEAMEAAGTFVALMDESNVIAMMEGILSEPDKAALADDEFRRQMADATRYAVVQTWRGMYDDDLAFCKPWGFDLASITVPVDLFYGDQDLMVPPSHGARLAAQLANATVHHFVDEGHVSVWVRHVDEVAEALAKASA
jgi:pimeloyl-ACP methyl ester carboxylesterase